ncbi:MAG: hypothetical protein KF713_14230, partial [Turneriella sp.]|nr:hypothetical protein [Turneriella sp.]
KLLEYFVYLESYKKYHPNERGELTRTIITIFGYKGKIVYYFAECMDDPKFNIREKPDAKDWLNEAFANYASQRSPEYLNWIKKAPY